MSKHFNTAVAALLAIGATVLFSMAEAQPNVVTLGPVVTLERFSSMKPNRRGLHVDSRFFDLAEAAAELEHRIQVGVTEKGPLSPEDPMRGERKGLALLDEQENLYAYLAHSPDISGDVWRIVLPTFSHPRLQLIVMNEFRKYIEEVVAENTTLIPPIQKVHWVSADASALQEIIEHLGGTELTQVFRYVNSDEARDERRRLAHMDLSVIAAPKINNVLPFKIPVPQDKLSRRRAEIDFDGSVTIIKNSSGEVLAHFPSIDAGRPRVQFDGPLLRLIYNGGTLKRTYSSSDYEIVEESGNFQEGLSRQQCISLFYR